MPHTTIAATRGETFSNVLHFALAAAFGLMSLHAAVHIITHLA